MTSTGAISGGGALTKANAGTLVLTGSNTYTGATTVSGGSLYVDGNQPGATGLTSVAAGATLGGSGTLGGDVTIASGATLSPGAPGTAPGTLTVNGNLALSSGSLLAYRFGQAHVPGGPFNDLTSVGGNLTLAGTLNITATPGGSFDPGVYRVFNYGGSLSGAGLALGAVPLPGLFVQTSVPGQVNLVNPTGVTLRFWDGAAGPKNNGIINGGNGTWQSGSGNDNWTSPDGTLNAPFSDGAFAEFEGQAGTVTVDKSLGQVRAAGMQFATGGYVINGDAIVLTGPSSIVRVGDGATDGAGYTATIDAVLSGATQLVKDDLGTLVLTGANTYTGGTAINGGTLQVAGDASLGAAAGPLSLDGGTLRTTATFATARATTLNAGGGTFDVDTGTTLTANGIISGAGALNKAGTGTLVLTADNNYAGGTTIGAGTLQLGNGGASGSIAGNIVDNGALVFYRSGALSLAGTISGAGYVDQLGTGTTILTGNSTYTGGTTISAGTLQLGNGGTSGSITGNVTDNGVLTFSRSDNVTFAGVISGSGSLNQVGPGATILTGSNSYAGPTQVFAGSLYINGNQSGATGATTVGTGATLGGSGTLGGDVGFYSGATLAPGAPGIAPGTLTVNGNLALSGGSLLAYHFGQAHVPGGPFNDLTRVGGNLTLAGTLNITTTPGGAFDPGVYRIFDYGGSLAGAGLALGAVPLPGLFLQTSVPAEVNLVNPTGVTLRFWDGAAGPKNNGIINGGNGTWQSGSGNDSWTSADGTLNAPFSDGAFAEFEGQPGTVTVDNSRGPVRAAGMQFAADGYVINGDAIVLTGPSSIIRVGDGATDGAGYTATIDAVLSGATQLVKDDLGTLVLTEKRNTYTLQWHGDQRRHPAGRGRRQPRCGGGTAEPRRRHAQDHGHVCHRARHHAQCRWRHLRRRCRHDPHG